MEEDREKGQCMQLLMIYGMSIAIFAIATFVHPVLDLYQSGGEAG